MQADIADYDELMTGQRREGSFSAVFSWIVKATNALTSGVGGVLLLMIGFNIKNGGDQAPLVLAHLKLVSIWIPVAFLILSLFAIRRYDLTRERMLDIRRQLESRRGTV